MNILCHGYPFCCDDTPIARYSGPHTIRSFGFWGPADYTYAPMEESLPAILKRIGRDWQPDLVLFWTPEMYPPPRDTEAAEIPVVACVSDWNIYYPRLAGNLARYDLVLCDKRGLSVFQPLGLPAQYAMPLYSHISTVHRRLDSPRDIDILFLGNLNYAAHPERTRLLERIARMESDYNIVIASGIDPENYAAIMNRARVVFNHSIRGELNLRVFETMACGALPMMERDNLEALDYFEDGVDIVLYSEEDLESVLRDCLADPDRLRRIAETASRQADAWAGESRFDALIEFCMCHLGRRRFAEHSPSDRAYYEWLQYAGSRFRVFDPFELQLAQQLAACQRGDPRGWTALGFSAWNEGPAGAQEAARLFYEAHRSARNAAPYAYNAAMMFHDTGRTSMEERCLRACLDSDEMAGADLVAPRIRSPFWARWTYNVATGAARAAQLHAQAHIRLAHLVASQARISEAERHLEDAVSLDPENPEGDELRAEVLWALGRRDEAADFLKANAARHPFDRRLRDRAEAMLNDAGRSEEAESYGEETQRIFSRMLNSPAGGTAP